MSSSLTGKLLVEQVGHGGLPHGEGLREVGEAEAVLLQALLGHVDVVVAVLLVQVDQRRACRAPRR